jgi:hypothetical protein
MIFPLQCSRSRQKQSDALCGHPAFAMTAYSHGEALARAPSNAEPDNLVELLKRYPAARLGTRMAAQRLKPAEG